MAYKQVLLGDYFKFEKGLGYKGQFLVEDSDVALIGMDSHEEGGGYKEGSEKPYSGPFKEINTANPGDVIFAATDLTQDGRVLGSPLLVPESDEYQTYIYSHHLLKAFKIQEGFLPEYLYNLYRCEKYRLKAAYADSGTTVRALPAEVLEEQLVPLPDLSIQLAINEIISLIDQQLANNRSLSKNLELLAESIFKSWFIDFDPVHAKSRGEKRFGMDDAIVALFPDSMEESELGLIPKGWSISKLGEYIKVTKGKSYKSSELEPSKTALVTLKSFKRGGGYRFDGLKPYSGDYKPEQIVEPGDLIVSFTDVTQAADVIGKPAIVVSNPNFSTLVASLDVGIVRTTGSNLGKNYLHQLFSTAMFKNHIGGYTNGTTVLHLGKNALEDFTVPLPDARLMSIFESFGSSIIDKLQAIYLQNLSLEQIKDSLLPRLISGELPIPKELLVS